MKLSYDNNRRKLLHMVPLSIFEGNESEDSQAEQTFTDETIKGLAELGEILKGIRARHKLMGYDILNTGIYNSKQELLYEAKQHHEAN